MGGLSFVDLGLLESLSYPWIKVPFQNQFSKYQEAKNKKWFEKHFWPWLVWLSGLSDSLQTEGLWI